MRMLSGPSSHRRATASAADRSIGIEVRAAAALVRSAARSLAERARGLAVISASSATIRPLGQERVKVGGRAFDLGRMARHAARCGRAR